MGESLGIDGWRSRARAVGLRVRHTAWMTVGDTTPVDPGLGSGLRARPAGLCWETEIWREAFVVKTRAIASMLKLDGARDRVAVGTRS
jgi:hypothetical protein